MNTGSPLPRPLGRLGVWCVLALYISLCSPLTGTLLATLGTFDRDHRVVVGAGTESIRVVLQHRSLPGIHHHGAVARTLTLFTCRTMATGPDHVLQFTAASAPQESKFRLSAQSDPTAVPPVPLAEPVARATRLLPALLLAFAYEPSRDRRIGSLPLLI